MNYFLRERYVAADRPAVLKIMHMIMIWYLAAVSGSIPERIWPVIIPGSETNPTANRVLIWGIIAVSMAILRAFR